MSHAWSRRTFLSAAGGLGAAAMAGPAAFAQRRGRPDPKFLIVLCGSGGCSLTDSFLAVPESLSANASRLATYPDQLVQRIPDSPFTAIDFSANRIGAIPAAFSANQSNFVKKHKQDMMVITQTGTSVNHGIAEHRSVTGNSAFAGRTMMEAAAAQYGEGYPIPNVHLVNGTTFTERGTDSSLPRSAYGERVTAPNLWPLSLDGHKGIKDAPSRELFEAARRFRNEDLDPNSEFYQVFGQAQRIRDWNELRAGPLRGVEAADLITKLMLFPDSEEMPLTAYGLKGSELGQKVRDAFPGYRHDPLESQAALAFLLLRFGISVTVTLGPELNAAFAEGASLGLGGLGAGDIINTPVGFDFSHQAHRETQALMWNRTLSVADRLIGLLKAEEYARGESYWDRSMIYVATEFGRTKNRPEGADSFGTGHDLNNGFLVISPMVNGNKVLGGVDPDTLLTYGYDPTTGEPRPGTTMAEAQTYAGIIQALGIETPGVRLPDMRAMRRA